MMNEAFITLKLGNLSGTVALTSQQCEKHLLILSIFKKSPRVSARTYYIIKLELYTDDV